MTSQQYSTATLPAWEDYLDALRPVANHFIEDGDNPGDHQELYRLLFSAIAHGVLNYVWSDPDYPDFKPGYDTALNLAAPVPDFRYKVTLINGDGSYRINGFRGTTRFVDITTFASLFSLGKKGPIVDRVSLDDLQLGPDGEFQLVLSAVRPAGYTGDWRALDPRAMRLQVRHAAYDWNNEVDARMAIERLDVPATQPRPTAADISDKLSKIAAWVENTAAFGIEHIKSQRERGLINKLGVFDWSKAGGFDPKVQTYQEGLFEIEDDEALILQTALPDTARYWSVLLSDSRFATIDWVNHQSSLNGYQAALDADGKFRGVIALHDPGVPNWLDPAGNNSGLIQVRWNECSSIPTPSAKKVKLAELRAHLPTDTPVITPNERDHQLRRRRQGAQMRSRW